MQINGSTPLLLLLLLRCNHLIVSNEMTSDSSNVRESSHENSFDDSIYYRINWLSKQLNEDSASKDNDKILTNDPKVRFKSIMILFILMAKNVEIIIFLSIQM